MSYYFATTLDGPFEEAVTRVKEAFKNEGFGVLAEIDVQAKLKEKLNVDFRPYRILGMCNPQFAHRAIEAEDKIGTMLPCNVILQKTSGGVEVAAVDPLASMQAVDNPDLGEIAGTVQTQLREIIENLREEPEHDG